MCRKVFGIDKNANAIEEARTNAVNNGISNCDFYAGNAEDVIPTIFALPHKMDAKYLLAVVDPPKAGLGTSISFKFYCIFIY